MKNLLFVIAFLGFLLPSTLFAAEVYHPAGTLEFRLETLTDADIHPLSTRPGIGVQAGDNTSFSMNLRGGIGYFVKSNLEVGGLAGINLYNDDGTLYTMPLAGFARFLVMIAPKVEAFVEGDLGMVLSKVNMGRNKTGDTSVTGDIGIKGGLDYLLAPSAALFAAAYVDFLIGDNLIVPIGVTYGMRAYF